jgi:phosphatidylglycerol:prolipoprotein diacylglycerol transferase
MINHFEIFGLRITFYGILVMLGALAAAWLTARRAKERKQDPEIVWDMFAWVLIGGVLGARIWHILTPPQSMVEAGMTTMWYLTHPLEMLQIWDGGLGIPGAIIGGGLVMYLYTRKHKYNFGLWLDLTAPGLALAQAIGRWGNFFNQELYGKPSALPWAITIDPQYRLPEYRLMETYHPLFLYESIWNLLNMGLLLFLGKRLEKWLKHGDLFLIYLMAYGLGRFLLEFLRLDSAQVGGINFNQTVMAVVALAAAAIFFWRHREESTSQSTKVESTKVGAVSDKKEIPAVKKLKASTKTVQKSSTRKPTVRKATKTKTE